MDSEPRPFLNMNDEDLRREVQIAHSEYRLYADRREAGRLSNRDREQMASVRERFDGLLQEIRLRGAAEDLAEVRSRGELIRSRGFRGSKAQRSA
jgi:hypothetical protein